MQPPGTLKSGHCTTVVRRLPALQVMGVGSGANCSWINNSTFLPQETVILWNYSKVRWLASLS